MARSKDLSWHKYRDVGRSCSGVSHRLFPRAPRENYACSSWLSILQTGLLQVYKRLGVNRKLRLSGRPPRPIGTLGTSKVKEKKGNPHSWLSCKLHDFARQCGDKRYIWVANCPAGSPSRPFEGLLRFLALQACYVCFTFSICRFNQREHFLKACSVSRDIFQKNCPTIHMVLALDKLNFSKRLRLDHFPQWISLTFRFCQSKWRFALGSHFVLVQQNAILSTSTLSITRQSSFDLWLLLCTWPHTPQSLLETSHQASHICLSFIH